jgi:hypothetical protein
MHRPLPSLALAGLCLAFGNARAVAADYEFFEKNIRPLLADKCYECHSVEKGKTKGGLALDTRIGWETGGDGGPAIQPGKPDESLLMQAVRYNDKDLKMPPKDKGGRLSDAEIAALEQWIRDGAADPREPQAKIGGMTAAEAKAWWAFQPVGSPKPPRHGNPIDAFIDTRLAEQQLAPAPLADARTLVRRMTFDLTGLPPSPEEVTEFEKAAAVDRPAAVKALIDRLLASPHYGEQWGRHWLDVVRYADSLDSRAYDKDGDILDAWRYRDWVVNAFNRDLPYDQFITQQVAGDLLAAQSPKFDPQLVIATGLYAIGNWGNGDADKEKVHTDIVDDQIDVTGRAFLGLTLSCTRCHDHKFDPFTMRDYYGMAGFFFSSRILARFQSKGEGEKLVRIALLSPEEKARREEAQKRLKEIEAELAAGLQPLTVVKRDIFDKPGLNAWNPKSADLPSLVINTRPDEVSFLTVKLPGRAISLHPSAGTSISAVWRSPIAGKVDVTVKLRDADGNCGNGIEWELRRGGEKIAGGILDNGGANEFSSGKVEVAKGGLLQVVIRPRGTDHICDSTQTEFVIRGEDGTVWDLRDALTSGAEQGQDNLWWVCAGEGAQLGVASEMKALLDTERAMLTDIVARAEFAEGLQDGGIPATAWEGFHDAKIHQRGRYDRLGELVPRSFPALLTREQPVIKAGSGRRELARWIANPENPLTARVMVNRIWQHHFGEGLVRTENNFGKLGQRPTHPELLDWLAAEFVKSGWSVKAIHRLILSSAAYQRASGLVLANDPDNLFLAHQNRRRLTAEELRDAMLCVTGELDRATGGKSNPDLKTLRRTLYVTSVRSDRSDYKALFDGADSTGIVEQRTESTVAPQALWMINHPFVLDRARSLAIRASKEPGNLASRLGSICQSLFQRQPTDLELQLASKSVSNLDQPESWESFCQALLCTNEFIYVD